MENQNSGMVLSGGDLLRKAWSVYAKNWKVYVPIMVVPFLSSTTINVFSERISQSGASGFMLTASAENFAFMARYGVGLFILGLLIMVSQLALIYSIKNSISVDVESNFTESYTLAARNFLSYLWISILIGVVVIAGLILLIIPGIIFGIWYGLALFVLVDDGIKGNKALKQSKEYVQGRLGVVFGRNLFILIITFVVSIIYTTAFGPVVAEAVSSFVLTPLVVLYSYLLYKNLKETKHISALEAHPVAEVSSQ